MLDFYNKIISSDERKRINSIEFLDEVEEWNLLMNHYCLTVFSSISSVNTVI